MSFFSCRRLCSKFTIAYYRTEKILVACVFFFAFHIINICLFLSIQFHFILIFSISLSLFLSVLYIWQCAYVHTLNWTIYNCQIYWKVVALKTKRKKQQHAHTKYFIKMPPFLFASRLFCLNWNEKGDVFHICLNKLTLIAWLDWHSYCMSRIHSLLCETFNLVKRFGSIHWQLFYELSSALN